MIASFGLKDDHLAARASLILLSLLKFFQSINSRGLLTDVRSQTGSISIAGPATLASVALAARAEHHAQASLAEEPTTDNPASGVPMFAVQTLLDWYSMLFNFRLPRLPEAVIEQVPERPDIQLLFAPCWRVLVFVFERSMEERRHTVACARIADAGGLRVSYPAW